MLKQYAQKYKTVIILSIIIFLLISLNLYMLYLLNSEEDEEEPVVVTKEEKTEEKLLKVDIKGEINSPGLYEVTTDSRVMDVIEKAGGLTDKADTSVINLSKKVKDEMVILVYSKTEVKKLKEKEEVKIVCPEVNDACANEDVLKPLVEEETKTNDNANTNTKISLNTATLEQLMTLTGIGESKAKAIIEYRDQNGKFEKVEDLKNVPGIGEAIFEKIKDQITI